MNEEIKSQSDQKESKKNNKNTFIYATHDIGHCYYL
jgi:hypothetical protein